jgi:hypothetical protein
MDKDKAIRSAKLTAAGILDKKRAKTAKDRAGGQIAPSKYMPGVPRQVHADGGKVVTQSKDGSQIFGAGSMIHRYVHPETNSHIEVLERPNGPASVLGLEVPEEHRGKGIGQMLQAEAMSRHPALMGQVSSKAAATTAYRLGRRPYNAPDASLDDVFSAIDRDSSVNMLTQQAQPKPGGGRTYAAGGYVPQSTIAYKSLPVGQAPALTGGTSMGDIAQLASMMGGKEEAATAPQHHQNDGHDHSGMSDAALQAWNKLTDAYGQPLTIVSGYRDPQQNAAAKGAKGSQHLHGNAYDVDTSSLSHEDRLALATQAYNSGFRGFGFYDNNMHFDVGDQRAWGPSHSSDSIPEWAQPFVQQYVARADGGKVENFQSWFGNSVTHTDGEPHVFYTGTSKDKDFTAFNVGRHGAWFTRDPEVASSYAAQNDSQGYKYDGWKAIETNTASRVIPAYVKAENPYTGEYSGAVTGNYKSDQSNWFDSLRAKGHDAWIPASSNGQLAVVLREPQQIKSIYNNGKFDPNQKHMNKAEGGGAFGQSRDNPGGQWLKHKQDYADPRRKYINGAITGTIGSSKDMYLPTASLKGVPGLNDERRVPGEPKFDALMEDVKKRGFKADQDDNKVVVAVNHMGQPYLLEGNTRVAVAHASGVPHVRAEVRYWNGGEDVDGDFHPDKVTAMAKPAFAKGGEVDNNNQGDDQYGQTAPLNPAPRAQAGEFPVSGGVRGSSGVLQAPYETSLEGLPQKVSIPLTGGSVSAGHDPRIRQIARDYMASTGMPYNPPTKYAKVDPKRASRIAAAYDDMKDDASDPLTKASYDAMIKETMAQYHAAKNAGFKAEFWNPETDEDPYKASPRLATEDVRNNHHMWVYPTRSGYGSDGPITAKELAENPLLQDSGETWNGQPVTVNDIFRAVHDYYGHAKEGVGFRGDGEENAWRSHASMYSPLARMAMTSETRGQNSWLNYGVHGDKNRNARTEDTIFAPQKIGIMPHWAHHEGAEDFMRPEDVRAMAEIHKRYGRAAGGAVNKALDLTIRFTKNGAGVMMSLKSKGK